MGSLWKVPDLAEFLGTSVPNTYYLIAHDRIPGVVRLGPRTLRINPDVVKVWVAAGGFDEAAERTTDADVAS